MTWTPRVPFVLRDGTWDDDGRWDDSAVWLDDYAWTDRPDTAATWTPAASAVTLWTEAD